MSSIRTLIAAVAVLLMTGDSLFGCCHAKDLDLPMFLDDNPRYPLVFAIYPSGHYLDLESCRVISGDEDNFEIYAEGVFHSRDSFVQRKDNPIYHFRKNEESDGELQFWKNSSKEWKTFPNPYDKETIEAILDETGYVDYYFPPYYIFKYLYRHLFGKSYEDDIDDEALQRTAIIWQRRETVGFRRYLWNDKNYPLVWVCGGWNWYLDKSSIYVEMEEPPQFILRVLVLEPTFLHYEDTLPRSIHSYRLLYDEDEGKMYHWDPLGKEWYYMTPELSDASLHHGIRYVGEAAFYLVYGEKFYDVFPRWYRARSPWLDIHDKWFYERLDGEME